MKKHPKQHLPYTVRYEGDGHLMTIAPTGSGKGVGVIIPNLLHYPGPAIVIDPKGENFAVTARYRQRELGQRIILLDPFRAVKDWLIEKIGVERGRLNPLDLCLLSATSSETDSQMLANLLSGGGTSPQDPFWDITGRKLLSGLIAHEMNLSKREHRPPVFRNVTKLLYADRPTLAMATMLDKEKPSTFVLSTVGGGFLGYDDSKLQQSVLAVTQSYLTVMMTDDIVGTLEDSTINLRDIQRKEDYTIYIVIPPTKLESHSVLLKTWVGVLMHAIMEREELPEQRTLFVLDECANLGELDVLRKAVTLLRGYGLQVWMFYQDLSQIERLYEKDYRTMINNCGVLQVFGVSRLSAAQSLASIIGGYKATEITRLDRTQQILSLSPGKVRVAELMKYYKDEAFSGRFEDHPMRPKSEPKRGFGFAPKSTP